MRNGLAIVWGLMIVIALATVTSCSPGSEEGATTVPTAVSSSGESRSAPDQIAGTLAPSAEVPPASTLEASPAPNDSSAGVPPLMSSPPAEGSPVLLLTDAGCSTALLEVPAEVPPELVVINEGRQPLVFTVPRFAVSMQLLPDERSTMPINPFIEGAFEYFCLDAITHIAIGGHEGPGLFACPLDSVTLAGVSRSEGTLQVERHQEVRGRH